MKHKRTYTFPPSILTLGLLIFGMVRLGAVSLDFQETEQMVAPGDQITLSTAFASPVANGLDAYYLRLVFPEGLFELEAADISVPQALDHSLFAPGAERMVSADFAEIRGFAEMGSPYDGIAFVSFTVSIGIDAPSGVQTLELRIPQVNSFVDGEQNVIDDQIVFGTATVTVVVPAPEIASSPSIDPATGAVALAFGGLAGRTYRLEASEDLVDWTLLEEITADFQGAILFEDSEASGMDRRFYRLVDR